ncbi:hypothetical protein PC129_g6264 [Phytophthora cactorum]|uniref:Uncharacterized protein n=1 Tax=Phytophthora cactorum TaxID=29920 RepID=A0A8T1IFZ4_9STRA|nr:hypothetical protein Pcac1_g3617 [Phytophthora cactorum]KAG2880560.1 hypothetical protein PC114_g22022 [Phytophthora cactorum]KAG2895995.1 hypothetical protein PC117_g23107 [Phytophthora cactorum]KAG2973543.1 hypothetical protein PC119_g22893 [Phytophthora cactorum]KAG2998584.1 hypothetical protein PC120_g21116 [Phytophthora cactorum]
MRTYPGSTWAYQDLRGGAGARSAGGGRTRVSGGARGRGAYG